VTVAEALRHGARVLGDTGVENPRQEARLLLGHAMGREMAWLIANPAVEAKPYDDLLARRAAHEPLAYILGHREFWSLDFQVSPATLIPRADSETVIEAAVAVCPDEAIQALDLGTGTGCLLLALLAERPRAVGVGVDIVPAAVALAARNAKALGLSDRAIFLCGDWDAALASARFDLVLGNPPYIPSADIATLMPDVAAHEPSSALDGGADGLAAYRKIVGALPRLLRPGGAAVLELGIGQSEAVAALAVATGFQTGFRADLTGIRRVIVVRRGLY
jgi:release factor glutamine methyltransferase